MYLYDDLLDSADDHCKKVYQAMVRAHQNKNYSEETSCRLALNVANFYFFTVIDQEPARARYMGIRRWASAKRMIVP
jgi:hypothetical protein